MNAKEYADTLKLLKAEGMLFNKLCESLGDAGYGGCADCPFELGINRYVISEHYKADPLKVSCEECEYYVHEDKYCNGWCDEIKKENHYCAFYKPKEDEK